MPGKLDIRESDVRTQRLYRKIASATKATVMTQRTMSLVVFFSSAIAREYNTPRNTVQVLFGLLCRNGVYGFDAVLVDPVRL